MARKLIGTAVTDENGEATITYTGTGAGQVNIVAESGTFQSGTYEVWDTIWNWEGTNGTVPPILKSSNNTSMPLISDSNGLSMTNSHSSNANYCGLDKEQSSSSIGDWIDWCDVAFEFEYVSHSGSVIFQLRPQSSSAFQYALNGCSNGDIIRVEYTNGVIDLYKNDAKQSTTNITVDELTAIRFSLAPSNTLTIKNMKLWSI